MKITVKLFAFLREGRGKIKQLDLAKESTTIRDILAQLNIAEKDLAIILLNGNDAKLNQKLKDGDVLALFPPAGGG